MVFPDTAAVVSSSDTEEVERPSQLMSSLASSSTTHESSRDFVLLAITGLSQVTQEWIEDRAWW